MQIYSLLHIYQFYTLKNMNYYQIPYLSIINNTST